jgi:zinc protease
LVLPGGSSKVPADRAGLADLAAEVITRGTESRTGPEIAREIEQIGGFMGASATADWFDVGVFALKDDAATAFEMLGDVVLNPIFPEQEVEVNRQRYLSDLEATLSDPGALAARAFSSIIYGSHPYGNLTSAETFNSITRDDIVAFYEEQLDADGALLIIAGDIETETALELAEATFGGMPVTHLPDTVDFPNTSQSDEIQVIIVNRPGPQSQYTLGNLAADRSDPNYEELLVLNEVLGGGVSSRLFQTVREQLGYAYSVGSSFTFNLDTGVFRASGASNNDVTDEAISQILTEIDTLRTETLSPEVIEQARGGLIGIESLALETYQSFVNAVTTLKLNDLPLSRIANRSARLAVVDEGDVRAVAEAYLHPSQLIIVVVGDASVLEEPLSEFGTVEVIEPR